MMRLLILGLTLICVLFLQIEAIENEEESNPCPDDSLPCNNGECVKRGEWCDGENNCRDESDEAYCKKRNWWKTNPNGCKDAHVLCSDGRCYPRVVKCDGHRDCDDGADEDLCDYDEHDNAETTSEILTEATTILTQSESNDLEDSEITTTQVPTVEFTTEAPLTSSIVDSYANRIEQERSQIDLQSPATVSTLPSTTPKPQTLPETHTIPIRQITTTSTPILVTDMPTRAHERGRYHDPSATPIPISPRQSIPKRLPDPSPNPAVNPPRSGQSYTPSYQPTRSHIQGLYPRHTRRDLPQYHNQPTRSYDYGRDSNHYQTQPTRSYYSRRDHYYQTQPTRSYVQRRDEYYQTQQTISYYPRRDPNYYQTQPTRPYDHRRDPNYYQTQPTIPYDPRRDPNYYRTQTTRPYDPRRYPGQYQTQPSRPDVFSPLPAVSTVQPQYRYHTTAVPYSRSHYATQRVYVDRENYYDGYYDQSGQFVVLYRSPPQQGYRRAPPVDERRYRQDPEINVTPQRRYWQDPVPTPAVFDRHVKAPPRFYFTKNYTRIYADGNLPQIQRAREWILSVQNSTGGWGKYTPRALIALSLVNNSFVNGTYDNDMMRKYFKVYLGTRLLRGDAEVHSLTRLAMSVNALLATCLNPRDFQGTDLTDLITDRLNQMNRERDHRTRTINPLVYLSLCLADRGLTPHQEHELVRRLRDQGRTDEYTRDMLSLSISAYSCHIRHQKSRDDSEHMRSMNIILSNATTKLLNTMKDDGSYGSVYSTALAAQALLSLNDTKHWNPELTLDFLKRHQQSDGSFGDLLATYLALPVLSGRSLLHLRNTQCTPEKTDRVLSPSEIVSFRGPKHLVRYSLHIGDPRERGFTMDLLVPQRTSFFDVMRVAQQQNDAFKFSYEERNRGIYVYSISNVPNDSERGFEWNLYVKQSSYLELNKLNPQERFLGDIRDFYPESDQHVIFWYHPIVFRR